jgi:hypothetical protein
MLIVKNIEVENVDEDACIIIPQQDSFFSAQFVGAMDSYSPEAMHVTREQIIGEKFINENGDIVCIGMTKQAQEAIGLPMKSFKNMNKMLADYKIKIYNMGQDHSATSKFLHETLSELRGFKNMTFLQRLIFLFKGGKYEIK